MDHRHSVKNHRGEALERELANFLVITLLWKLGIFPVVDPPGLGHAKG